MPVLTITGVDAGTDRLTIAAHGQVTGAGPAAVRNIGGALPGNVSPVTDYWLIVIDANTVQLADSSALAMAGTPRDITSVGSGTNLLEIGIPYRRARTYVAAAVDAAGAQLKSADLNAKMDALKALHALFTAQAQSIWTDLTLQNPIVAPDYYHTTGQDLTIPGSLWVDPNNTHTQLLSAAGAQIGWAVAASGNKLTLPIPVRAGDRITGWTVYVKKQTNNTNTITARLFSHTDQSGGGGTETGIGAAVTNNGNAPQFIALSQTGLMSGQSVIAGNQYYLVFTPGGGITPAADLLLHAFVTIERPKP